MPAYSIMKCLERYGDTKPLEEKMKQVKKTVKPTPRDLEEIRKATIECIVENRVP